MSAREDAESAVVLTACGLRDVAEALAAYARGDVIDGVLLMERAKAGLRLAAMLAERAVDAAGHTSDPA